MENLIFSAVRVTSSDAEMIVIVYFYILFWFILFFSVSTILSFFTYNVLSKLIEQYREIFTRFSYYCVILNPFDLLFN